MLVCKNELIFIDYIDKDTRGLHRHSRNILNMKVTKFMKIIIHVKEGENNLIKMFDVQKWTRKDIFSWPYLGLKDFDKMEYSSSNDFLIIRIAKNFFFYKVSNSTMSKKQIDDDHLTWKMTPDTSFIVILYTESKKLEVKNIADFITVNILYLEEIANFTLTDV